MAVSVAWVAFLWLSLKKKLYHFGSTFIVLGVYF